MGEGRRRAGQCACIGWQERVGRRGGIKVKEERVIRNERECGSEWMLRKWKRLKEKKMRRKSEKVRGKE